MTNNYKAFLTLLGVTLFSCLLTWGAYAGYINFGPNFTLDVSVFSIIMAAVTGRVFMDGIDEEA